MRTFSQTTGLVDRVGHDPCQPRSASAPNRRESLTLSGLSQSEEKFMECDNGHHNPAGSSFCNSCGTQLAPVCQNGHKNPVGSSFCNQCGINLTPTEAATRHPKDVSPDVRNQVAEPTSTQGAHKLTIKYKSTRSASPTIGTLECICGWKADLRASAPDFFEKNAAKSFDRHVKDPYPTQGTSSAAPHTSEAARRRNSSKHAHQFGVCDEGTATDGSLYAAVLCSCGTRSRRVSAETPEQLDEGLRQLHGRHISTPQGVKK
ncbi:unnamed protein product, partial [Wuchereria bancrofti]